MWKFAMAVSAPLALQSQAMNALPTLRAATDRAVEGGHYYGPDRLAEQRGHPKLVQSSAQSHDEEAATPALGCPKNSPASRSPV